MWKKLRQNTGIVIGSFLSFLVIVSTLIMLSDSFANNVQVLLGGKEKREFLKFLGLGISGLIALYGLFALNKRAEAQVENNELTEKNNRLTEKGLSQERFRVAVEHLSSDKVSLRMSSFYELFHLAKDNKKDYGQTITDILCAHLRQKTNYANSNTYTYKTRPREIHSEEVGVLFGILFGEENGEIFDGCYYDLNRANLACFKFNLKKRKNEIDFSNANLSRTTFFNGNLSGSNFSHAEFHCAEFHETDLHNARFFVAKLQHAKFMHMDLSKASFFGATMPYASFLMTNLENADFSEADLRHAQFLRVKSLETVNVKKAEYNNFTEFPKGYNPKDNGMKHVRRHAVSDE